MSRLKSLLKRINSTSSRKVNTCESFDDFGRPLMGCERTHGNYASLVDCSECPFDSNTKYKAFMEEVFDESI